MNKGTGRVRRVGSGVNITLGTEGKHFSFRLNASDDEFIFRKPSPKTLLVNACLGSVEPDLLTSVVSNPLAEPVPQQLGQVPFKGFVSLDNQGRDYQRRKWGSRVFAIWRANRRGAVTGRFHGRSSPRDKVWKMGPRLVYRTL
jgi:hypothetical protein